jgi:hypothetical protein
MLIMVVEAARQLADPKRQALAIEFHDVKFERGLVVPGFDDAV